MGTSVLPLNLKPTVATSDFAAYPYPTIVYENIAEVKSLYVSFFHVWTLLFDISAIIPILHKQVTI